jgi:4-amino-4-deoxy-L-arabinose transferase-like glycosyltransferase
MERSPADIPTLPVPRALVAALAVALAARVAAALVVESFARRAGGLCLFDDTRIYWHLAGTILRGEPFVVMQYEQPHFALRTPGYPLWLAAYRALFGDSTLAPRFGQAILGTAAVAALAALVRRLVDPESDPVRARRAAVATAWLAALEPYGVGMSALLLSEGLFAPLLILGLWALAAAFDGRGRALPALAAGLLQGALVMVRPSYAVFPAVAVPLLMILRRPHALRAALLVAVAAVAVMAPWWARNARVYGAFVPTSLWLGASLYDGLSPTATGASDMRFLDDPAIRALDEHAQDRFLRDEAVAFARANPGRALELAVVKLGRFLSPWPNAEMLRGIGPSAASALVVLPLYALILAGAWDRRRDARTLLLLLGPLACTAAVHLAFVSSIRYRIPVLTPALGLAGVAVAGRLRPAPRGGEAAA